MKTILKFCLGIIIFSAIVALGAFVAWCVASVFVVRYLFKLKGKYKNPKDCLKEGKNIVAIVAALVLFIVIPVGFAKTSREYDQEQKIKQEQQAKLEEQQKIEAEQKQKDRERANILNAKSRVKKAGKDANVVLTEEEIEKYNITDEEIAKFDEAVEAAVIGIEDAEMAKKFEREAKNYVKKNLDYTAPNLRAPSKYSFNEEGTICTIKGTYKSKNKYGVDVKGEYSIDFDTASGEIVDEFIGNEKVNK